MLRGETELPPVFWGKAQSGLACLDHVVADVWREGYSHHITRLMVLGNLATLLGVEPQQLSQWFWVAYVDAYDWVVEPNVLAMASYGVGELMTEVAGEVCDGFICHGFTTEKYLREVTIPALARGRAKAGKTMEGFEIVGPSFVVTGNNEEEMKAAAAGTRQQIAFYGSTPAYRNVLEIHGWGELQDELNRLSKQGQWVEMGNLITDEILETFAVVGAPETVAPELHRRYGDVIERISFYAPYKSDPERWSRVLADLKAS